MIEHAFRITQEQLDSVASRLAGNGADHLIIATCGTGSATWPSNSERISWSFQRIEAEVALDDTAAQLRQGQPPYHCVFADNKELIEKASHVMASALWACLDSGNLQVFYIKDKELLPVDVCCVTGHDLYYRFCGKDPMTESGSIDSELFERTMQAFGRGTTHYLSNLTVGIAGVSGTGSIVAEQLLRLGVKRLVLVDDDIVEVRNLGRILNSTVKDAEDGTNKAIMMKRVCEAIGLPTEVVAAPTVISASQTLHWLSQCDLLFGCLDSADGRMQLNYISTFYTIPYIDLGVSLSSPHGQITEVSGAIRYVLPGGASLRSMHAYSDERLTSDSLRRNDPVAYRARLDEKYIAGAKEGSPAVISVNMLVAALGVQELLNRLHPFRETPNSEVEVITVDMREPAILSPSAPLPPDTGLAKHLGRGDIQPLLGLMMAGDAT